MAKSAAKKSAKPTNKFNLYNMMSKGYALPALVMLVFGGIGGYYLASSHAATTTSCFTYAKQNHGFWSGQGYQTHNSFQGNCVHDIQTIVNFQLYGYRYSTNGSRIGTDGQYGPQTANAVMTMQRYYKGHGFPSVTVDGAAGIQTFSDMLCREQSYKDNSYYSWNSGIASALNGLGCPTWWG
jgi:hypothetical protein